MKEIWVFAEMNNGELSDVSFELLGAAKGIADESSTVCAFICGTKEDILTNSKELFQYGAEKIYAASNELLKHYTSDGYAMALEMLLKKYMPDIVLFGATVMGKDLAPVIAADLDTGLTADATRIDIDNVGFAKFLENETTASIDDVPMGDCASVLKATKPAFGGNLLATIICPKARPQMASIRPGVMEKPAKNEDADGEIIFSTIEISEDDLRVKVKEVIDDITAKSGLADAEIVVGGGRGLDKEGFELLKEFAEKIGAEVGVSRSLVDNGWADVSMQIGQSGVFISPKLYINFGISGVIQHTSGILGSDTIVSVNIDEKAPIFEVSDYCIVADAKETLKEFIKNW